MKLREEKNGALIGYVLVKSCEKKVTKNGSTYLDMVINDSESDVVAKIWDFKEGSMYMPEPNKLLLVRGTLGMYNNQPQFRIERYRALNDTDEVDISAYIPSAPFPGEEMFCEIEKLSDSFKDPELAALTKAVLSRYKSVILSLPAAYRLHHAIRGGLLMHTLSICKLCEAAAALYPSVDRDLLLTGAILHDVAKSEEFSLASTGLVEGYTVPGTLIGHLVKGAMIVEEIGKEAGVCDDTRMLVEHMLISHHGEPDYGAAVRPLFLEAELLSALDTLDANVYEIESAVQDLKPGVFSNRMWALNDRKFYRHGRTAVTTDVRFDWQVVMGASADVPAAASEGENAADAEWTEIVVTVPANKLDVASDVVTMTVPYGIYIEDYSHLEEEAMEVAKIDLIDEELLKKDRTKGLIHVYIAKDNNPAEAVSYIEARFSALGIPYELAEKDCDVENWASNWKKYFLPIPVGEKLLIRPAWIDDYDAAGRTVLTLEPGVAFGTGNHETTRLCLEALEKVVTPRTNLLDVGCGSGILSIAALLLGAERAVGVDIDPLAVKVAAENGRLNDLTPPRFEAIEGDLATDVTGKFDVVTANIVADAIIALTPAVKRFLYATSVYIVSGIIDTREAEVTEVIRNNGFRILNRYEENGWICMVCKLR